MDTVNEVSSETLETMVNTINNLVNMIQQLNEEYKEYRMKVDRTIADSLETFNSDLVIRKFSGKAEPKNFRIYPEVVEKLELIKNKYPSYNTQAIVNTILFEGISKYLRHSEKTVL